ncbi:MAG TPA: dihydrolipoamide acetyltransferase family protein [Acidimicrobiia bacterium]|nr:dihydrolipoamide acetyltransferase family protein [Acidimicrobiia bacterium]
MSHEFRMPDIGEGLTEAEIVAWLVSVGDAVTVGQPVVEVETAKTTVEITATHAGTIDRLMGSVGDTVNVGDVLFVVGGGEADGPPDAAPDIDRGDATHPADVATSLTASSGTGSVHVRATPAVRRLADSLGVDLASLEGTGPGGAITRDDVERVSGGGSGERLEPLTATRRAIAAHMAESWSTIPHVTVQGDIRAEALLEARTSDDGGPLPVEALVAKSVMPLLSRYREFNASFRGSTVAYRDAVHMGFAVDTEAGLMVVVVKDAHSLSVRDLATEFERLATAAINGTVTPSEVTGQTFTVSNIGALGGGHGTPIIPMGTSAILSIGRASPTPIVEDGEVAIGLVAPIDLSYDHRIIDGALGQRFLADLMTSLEVLA